MATSKSKAKPNKAVAKANEAALTGFQRAKLRAAFDSMASTAAEIEGATESKAAAAATVTELAHAFSKANDGVPVETIVKGWRDNMATLARELAASGNRFAETLPGKGDQPDRFRFTGYGNNVVSIAKGVIEFDIEPSESYRETRKQVEAARLEARRESDPEAAAFTDAVAELDSTWKDLRKRLVETRDREVIGILTEMLAEHIADLDKAAEIASESETDDAEPEAKAA